MSPEVERGVALLDRVRPGWERDVNVMTIDIRSWKNCVLGQVYGSFSSALSILIREESEFGIDFASSHGFAVDARSPEWRTLIHAELASSWREAILARRRNRSVAEMEQDEHPLMEDEL